MEESQYSSSQQSFIVPCSHLPTDQMYKPGRQKAKVLFEMAHWNTGACLPGVCLNAAADVRLPCYSRPASPAQKGIIYRRNMHIID